MSARFLSLFGGVLIAIAAFFATQRAGLTAAQSWTTSVTALCAMWWVLEALPLAATALVPLVVFPLTGVLTDRQAAASYGDPIILLFMGGFMLSKAIEHWGAHERIAHITLAAIGGSSGRRIVLGMLLATTLISMWISNTAVALMMLPVAMALVDRDKSGKLAVPLLLSVAYGSSIGGIATPIGTAPNGVFMFVYHESTGQSVAFFQWMLFGIPLSLVMMMVAWFLLTFRLGKVPTLATKAHDSWTTPQKRTLAVFGLAALAWTTREIPYGGWQHLIGYSGEGGDMIVAVTAALAMFLIPAGNGERERTLLDWKTASRISWGILILFGGGLAIATAFKSSGLSEKIGDLVQGLRDWPTLAVIATVCFTVTFLSEFTSNTASANILMPILAATAKANGMNPALLMIPATFSNSLAFMMPVGTPPNAIVYGTGHIRIAHMVRAGFMLNVAGATIVTFYCWWLLPLIFG
jgi:sodium-dependent dicarboxylate transporter 2/3/5